MIDAPIATKICPHCKHTIPARDLLCVFCGQDIRSHTPVGSTMTTMSPIPTRTLPGTAPRIPRRFIFAMVAGIIFVILNTFGGLLLILAAKWCYIDLGIAYINLCW